MAPMSPFGQERTFGTCFTHVYTVRDNFGSQALMVSSRAKPNTSKWSFGSIAIR